MKKIVLQEQKISTKTDVKIKMKLYTFILKKRIINLFRLNNIKFVVPALMLGVFSIWLFHFNFDNNINNHELTNVKTVNINKRIENIWNKQKVEKYENIAQNRILRAKMHSYKQRAFIRKLKVRD